MYDHGMVDMVSHRKELKEKIRIHSARYDEKNQLKILRQFRPNAKIIIAD